jgi:hypothetical protein
MKSKVLKIIGKGILWTIGIIAGLYLLLIIIRIPHVIKVNHTNIQIDKIHNTKLTLVDVMGDNLPKDPGIEADKTVAGIDANKNGIRDDVELAIFKEYPNSAKTRAALLQYALSFQLQMTLPLINQETATATIEDTQSRAQNCIHTLSSRDDLDKFSADMKRYREFIKNIQLNNEQRKKYLDEVLSYVKGFSFSNDGCDLDPETLPN